MNLNTTYLGLQLRSPLVASASPLSHSLDNIKRLEDAGAGAVVLYSLFEEQLRQEQMALFYHLNRGAESYAEALSYFPEPPQFHTNAEGYLDLIRKAKEAVGIPIIASLNGTLPGRWGRFAEWIAEAGADALELNLYQIPANIEVAGHEIESNDIAIVDTVCRAVKIPVAVKMSPFFSSPAHMIKRFASVGAQGVVLFNRFYQPDIDLDDLTVKTNLLLSSSAEVRLPLRWIAILYGRVQLDFAATSGVHTGADVMKLILAGANVTMLASALLRHGIHYLRTIEAELITVMEQHEYESVGQMRGALSQIHSENPAAFERAQYMQALNSYAGEILP
ncbi:MAG: dihydroorotate dehydrogenase-like protein [Phototrophicaceae bacterium]|jgi:dihydroorotate dehydrogenase (fumarate)